MKSMVIVLGDLIVDITMKFPAFPIRGGELHRSSFIDIGPGGGCNIAIMASRLGLPVRYLGEIGGDAFGEILLQGLLREGIDTKEIYVNKDACTPSVAVLVDKTAEPAYLGYAGRLTLRQLPDSWKQSIKKGQALFADGWVEYEGMQAVILEAFRQAKTAGCPVFYDPGPGNPDVDNGWMKKGIELCTVLLVNQSEAQRESGEAEVEAAGKALLNMGPEIVVIKRGGEGIMLLKGDKIHVAPAYPVEVKDTTGAGDCVAGAVIYGYLHDMALPELGIFANAVGSAKVSKIGTGHNLPTPDEIRAMARKFHLSLPI